MKTDVQTRILLIDDAAALRGVLKALFINQGYTVLAELGEGRDVLDTVRRLQPDLVCLDYHLPDIDGITLLKGIRAEHPHILVVMITADRSPEVESEALAAGAVGFIRKPFTQDRVAEEMRQVLETQRAPPAAAAPDPHLPRTQWVQRKAPD